MSRRAQIQQFSSQISFSGDQFSQLTGVGDIGRQRSWQQVPEQFRAFVEPLIPAIVRGIHDAFSLAIGDTMWLARGGRGRGNDGHAGSPRGAAAQLGPCGEPYAQRQAQASNEPAPAAE